MKVVFSCVLIITLIMFSCRESLETDYRLVPLQKNFDGKWSIYQKDNCVILSVENSSRIIESPDSLLIYIDMIDSLTQTVQESCVNLDVQKTNKSGLISSKSSKIYRVRP